jgi:uncharacterized protein YbjT (DUF2867 family)
VILVTGATGFTGRYVVEELVKRRLKFRCLVRDSEKIKKLADLGIECVIGNVNDPLIWDRILEGCNGIINIVSFKEGHITLLIKKAESKGIKRVLCIGTTAIFTKLDTKSKELRVNIESKIMNSSLDWTVLRPTMIYGAPGDRNMERLINAINKYPIHPILGSGQYKIQPIYVKDLSNAIVDAFVSRNTYRKAYNLSGKTPITYKDCVKTIAALLGKNIMTILLPVKLSYYIAEFCCRIHGLPRIKGEQVLRLNEDKDFSYQDAAIDFNFSPREFRDGIVLEIKELQDKKII